jgi:hypothetical protein
LGDFSPPPKKNKEFLTDYSFPQNIFEKMAKKIRHRKKKKKSHQEKTRCPIGKTFCCLLNIIKNTLSF